MSATKGEHDGVDIPGLRSPGLPDRDLGDESPSIGAQLAELLDLVGLTRITLAEAGALVEARRRNAWTGR
jgi:hypothetical protein